jgi:hypothetical protein
VPFTSVYSMRVAGAPVLLLDRQLPLTSHESCAKKLPLPTMAPAAVDEASIVMVSTLPPPLGGVSRPPCASW